MNKISLLLLLLVPFSLLAQSKKIKGRLTIEPHFCNEKEKPKKLKPRKGKDIAVILSSDLYMSHKLLRNTNRNGVFRIKLSKEELENYKFLVFAGDSIQTSFITLESIKSKFTLEIARALTKDDYMVGKPAIYLYPAKQTQINVKLDFKGKIGTTYPIYKEGWDVIANPNGELLNISDNRKYNYLFWDGTYPFSEKHFAYTDGFVVKKENTAEFLLSKLSHLGLNNTEINDFIVYWLPQLEMNKANFIHFWINDNIDSSSFLNVTPKPDTEIVVFMEFKSVAPDFKCVEQILPKLERKGFTIVEWGGTNRATKKIE